MYLTVLKSYYSASPAQPTPHTIPTPQKENQLTSRNPKYHPKKKAFLNQHLHQHHEVLQPSDPE